ncbi:hypothetical protein QBC47DRAFT_360017 [Echria macrotheca]|uniref:Uncharacterized protein n=1 Tax=Echria macrotheca TaxID=438768 RepID=A0AAJ0BDM3_9PEZI|nr:hypothetical protein QBC47DRAFT_360017 [Echria macrotheca]
MASTDQAEARLTLVQEFLMEPVVLGGFGLEEDEATILLADAQVSTCMDLYQAGTTPEQVTAPHFDVMSYMRKPHVFPWQDQYSQPEPGPVSLKYRIWYTRERGRNEAIASLNTQDPASSSGQSQARSATDKPLATPSAATNATQDSPTESH